MKLISIFLYSFFRRKYKEQKPLNSERNYKYMFEALLSKHGFRGRFIFEVVKNGDYYLAVRSVRIPRSKIVFGKLYINQECDRMKPGAVKSLLMHELAHVINHRATERDCDKFVIDNGGIEGLIAFHEYHNKKYKKYKKKEGYTLKELQGIRKAVKA